MVIPSEKDPWTSPFSGNLFELASGDILRDVCFISRHQHLIWTFSCGTGIWCMHEKCTFYKTRGQFSAILQYLHCVTTHDDVIKWKHFPRYWPFVRGIHRSPVNSLHKGQWCGSLMFSLICAWMNGWVNNREAGDLRRHRAHYDAIVMTLAMEHLRMRECGCYQQYHMRHAKGHLCTYNLTIFYTFVYP